MGTQTETLTEYRIDNTEETRQLSEFSVLLLNKAERGNKKNNNKTFIASRQLQREQTNKRPIQGDLFSTLTEQERNEAIQCQSEGNLLSSLVTGINGGEIQTKIIIALSQTLFQQSDYNTTKQLFGIHSNEEMSSHLIEQGLVPSQIPTKRQAGGVVLYEGNERRAYPEPFILVEESSFTKLVLGKDTTPTTKERGSVTDTLEDLAKKKVFLTIDQGDGVPLHIGTPLYHIKHTLVKGKKKAYIIQLTNLFTRAIEKDHVIMRTDSLKYLSGRQNSITFRLFAFLTEQYSYHKESFPIERVAKSELFQKVAVLNRYAKNPKDRESDFQSAIQKMLEMGLITDYKEVGEPTAPTCEFTFNKSYDK